MLHVEEDGLMELVTLNATTNQAEKLVEKYDSLIWTERFNTVGEFQLIAGDVSGFLTMLPEGQVVSLRESNVAMVVETHEISRKKNQPQTITVKGRSFESILDRRVAVLAVAGAAGDWIVNAKIPSDVAYYIISQICVTGILDANDIFPSSIVQFATPADYLSTSGPTKSFSVSKGNLLAKVLELLQIQAKADPSTSPATPVVVQHGIRAIRPAAGATAIGIQIYTGTDRSTSIYFDATRDMLDDGNYLFSKVGSASTAYIIGPSNAVKLNKSASAATGLARRVILVDGTASGETSAAILQQQGELSLAEAVELTMFDGSINQDLSPYKYNVDYFLGDTVKVVGDYGLTRMAVVTEYIRSEDDTGIKGYPTLATIT
jgi:hypothetical protein